VCVCVWVCCLGFGICLDDTSRLVPRVVSVVGRPHEVDDPCLHGVEPHALDYPLIC